VPDEVGAVPATDGATGGAKSKDDIARERLVPLVEGERPVAVTVAAVVAGLLVLGSLVGIAIGESDPATTALSVLLAVTAFGMWRARYWAVLGFQVVLAITAVNALLFLLLRANAFIDFVVGLVIAGGSGTLFWFLVRSLARIQMPERRPR
jgi:hypothetical protein